eukprot:10629046-Heterocapsa_arctica.AAC.1
MVGLLKMTMYGTVDASAIWQSDYASLLKGACFNHGKSSPALFYHEARQTRLPVHGDDFAVEMRSEQRAWFEQVLAKYEYKRTGLFTHNAGRQE